MLSFAKTIAERQMAGTPGGGDVGPTDQLVAVNNGFKQELAAIAVQYKEIVDKDLPTMDALLTQNGVAATITAEPPSSAAPFSASIRFRSWRPPSTDSG